METEETIYMAQNVRVISFSTREYKSLHTLTSLRGDYNIFTQCRDQIEIEISPNMPQSGSKEGTLCNAKKEQQKVSSEIGAIQSRAKASFENVPVLRGTML